MMRVLFFLLAGLSYLHPADAQVKRDKVNLGVGLLLAVPVYNLDFSTTGGGVDITGLYGVTDHINITADVGFTGLPGKNIYPSTAIIPIRFGVRYFPTPKLYLGAKAGLGIYTILKASANHTAYSATAGYLIKQKLDAGFYYDGYSNKNTSFGYSGIRLTYYLF